MQLSIADLATLLTALAGLIQALYNLIDKLLSRAAPAHEI